ncbi:hypothetical protein KC19_VG266400 [Ceratodon purpureus]|uniref:Peptidyl-tRNA hydrolase n=1 Tax=Ceratodon purpureus TaxID=3225 RepID=A0A8T0HTY7_CERPU|nr:hypothetical protein KC19_VG266400 [Ceratodon purpureus]KAG0574500.1 hypothetical protein KC19_VG266400 [Ceratodon purpureus]KAG0574501.1 hypothetical protein KC19_VG266400 [Ceratodon purpureus]KAG0574502.1 hypothetical protein KC19_VG266400 [Ceratodon purpureus]
MLWWWKGWSELAHAQAAMDEVAEVVHTSVMRFPGAVAVAAISPASSPASLAICASSWVSSLGSGSDASPSSGHNLPWLIVGLGNPGSKFEGTRHNLLDSSEELSCRSQMSMWRVENQLQPEGSRS